MSKAGGGCLCGAMRYAVGSEPTKVTICHCKFCQRATGSAFLVEPIFAQSDFKLTNGEARVYEHRSESSGKRVHIHFCDVCGTKLFLTFERFVDIVGVYGGTFDDPNWFSLIPEKTKPIFLGVARKGSVVLPGIDSYFEHATSNDGTPIEPRIFDEPTIIGLENMDGAEPRA